MKNLILTEIALMGGLTGGAMSYIASEKVKFIHEAWFAFYAGGISHIILVGFYLFILRRKK